MVKVGHAGTCVPREIGPDTSLATAGAPMEFGHGIGETFMATDTLIEAITVWRAAADDTSFAGWDLFIVGTDSLGVPDLTKMLLHRKIVHAPYAALLAPMTFSFDPPFALPAPGKYELAVQLYPCGGLGYLLLSQTDVYPDGELWYHNRAPCDHLSGGSESPTYGLIFNIVFCEQSVPTEPATWGRTRARYR